MQSKNIRIKSALISVYHKTGLDNIANLLHQAGVKIYSTGGTQTFFEERGIPVERVEDLTTYPSILGGRVKTLHPKVFGAILGRRDLDSDVAEMETYEIPTFDLVVVDLYPFEETTKSGGSHEDIIEKIDIGGISLIRAAAKNNEHVLVIPSQDQYATLEKVLAEQNGEATLEQRREMAGNAFKISSHYDNLISAYILDSKNASGSENSSADRSSPVPTQESANKKALRYGENPHQKAWFEGNLDEVFEQIQGKELSYNNLVDIDAALGLVDEFTEPAVCIIKHTNPCGVATGENLADAYRRAFEADTVSAFGGIIAFNRKVDVETATDLDKLFFEVCTAPEYEQEALSILTRKKNRMILKVKSWKHAEYHTKTALNGLLVQDQDSKTETEADFTYATEQKPSAQQVDDLLFANKIAKHAKSNTIVLVKNRQLCGIGVGQTSRVDALEQAIDKAKRFNLSVDGAAMASDAFFPFPDCVEIAHKAGISSVIHPGGSIRDKDSIDYCNQNGMTMVLTGFRHFKH
mgnify:CR=1 FL=1